jgi:ankyrin repeat protein
VFLCALAAGQDIATAIRANDLAAVKKLAANRQAVNAKDSRGNYPLHHAALTGSLEAVKLLLDNGAEVNARNSLEMTPLMLAAFDAAKARLLVERGADVKAVSKMGRSALMMAAGVPGNAVTVRLLLSKGADVNAADEIGNTALTADFMPDHEVVRLLVEAGAKVNHSNKSGWTPLMSVVGANNLESTKLLVSKGADVNAANTFAGEVKFGLIALRGLTPLMLAAPFGSPEMIKTLLDAGAKVNARDVRKMTPLMFAAASENQDIRVVRMLVAAGTEINAASDVNETALDWAMKTGNPEIVAELKKAGATKSAAHKPPERPAGAVRLEPAMAVRKGMKLAGDSSAEFFKQSGCLGCHHQPQAARAYASVRAAGIHEGAGVVKDLEGGMIASRAMFMPFLTQLVDLPGNTDMAASWLIASSDAGLAASPWMDLLAHYIAVRQQTGGHWMLGGITRPPFEESNIERTALAIRALRAYGWPARQAEFDASVARAVEFLRRAKPRTSYERASQLLGLYWGGAPAPELKPVAKALVGEQHTGGGWSQNRHLAPDAYATGLALYALSTSGTALPGSEAYSKGVRFLLDTQMPDGSWYVRSRAPKFQPYFQSGFPYDHDQWISMTATTYALMGLAPAAHAPMPTN